MSPLVAMFCDIDDFCKTFEPLYQQRLLASAGRHRRRPTALALSEIMTIIVAFHSSHYRDCKAYYVRHVRTYLRPSFPQLVSYNRFVELMPRALVPLSAYLKTRYGTGTGIAFIDSTPIAVCHNRRILCSRGSESPNWNFN